MNVERCLKQGLRAVLSMKVRGSFISKYTEFVKSRANHLLIKRYWFYFGENSYEHTLADRLMSVDYCIMNLEKDNRAIESIRGKTYHHVIANFKTLKLRGNYCPNRIITYIYRSFIVISAFIIE